MFLTYMLRSMVSIVSASTWTASFTLKQCRSTKDLDVTRFYPCNHLQARFTRKLPSRCPIFMLPLRPLSELTLEEANSFLEAVILTKGIKLNQIFAL